MHLVMTGQARQRTELHQIGNSPSLLGLDDDDEDAHGNKPAQPVVPLAARTADGLVYLAQVVKKVRLLKAKARLLLACVMLLCC